MSSSSTKTLVVGIGNEYRGDDAAGLYVARKLAELTPPGCDIMELTGDETRLMDNWAGYRMVVLIDAVRAATVPGKIHRIDAANENLPRHWRQPSSHTVSLQTVVELARSLGLMPQALLIYGVEGCCFKRGTTMSPDVQVAADQLIPAILSELTTPE